ncbi:MAG: hypothetical protein JXA42_09335 [Anaerolineales bacterium]|nr:hypothetical protein [Anaerolineales bacterium]
MAEKKIIRISDFSAEQIAQLFELADRSKSLALPDAGGLSAGYSFEGNSIRTRATFIKALNDLHIAPIEIPNLLKMQEAPEHLAGYLDNWFDLYIIRDRNHEKLVRFADCTGKPVINAMTSEAHPCEVLADLYSVWKEKGGLARLKFCVIGPPTNVLNSWLAAGKVLGLEMVHVRPQEYAPEAAGDISVVHNKQEGLENADVILTDAWPPGFEDRTYHLTLGDLKGAKTDAWVIPCPPFNVENEVDRDVVESVYFAGYGQKRYLYDVQKALIVFLLCESAG